VPDIFKLPTEDMTGLHRQIRMFALQRLHAGQLIYADRPFSQGGSFSGVCIDLTALGDFLFPPVIGNFRQPIAETMRLQSLFFSR